METTTLANKKCIVRNKKTGKYFVEFTANDGHSIMCGASSGISKKYTKNQEEARVFKDFNDAWDRVIMELSIYGRYNHEILEA